MPRLRRVVSEAFAVEKPALKPLQLAPCQAVLKIKRRMSHEGVESVDGNLYSVPNTTRRRIIEVHVLADEIRLFEERVLVACHAPLEGRTGKRLEPAHRRSTAPPTRRCDGESMVIRRASELVARRLADWGLHDGHPCRARPLPARAAKLPP